MTSYCGTKDAIPEGYERIGTNHECLKKGFGICKYSGKFHTKSSSPAKDKKKKKEKIYCGNDLLLPDGYDRFATRYECLKRGFGVCMYGPAPGNTSSRSGKK